MRRSLNAFLLTTLAFGGGLVGGTTLVREAAARAGSGYTGLDTLARALSTMEDRYVEPIPTEQLVVDAITGMADARDTHTRYLDPETWRAMQVRTEGEEVGAIGLRVFVDGGEARIEHLTPGGPAELAGLVEGDVILPGGVLGAELGSAEEIEERFQGPVDSTLALTVRRGDEVLQVLVVRDVVREPATEGELLEPGLAYLRLTHFQREAAHDLQHSLDELGAEEPLTGAIIDLRGNGGGLLEEAVAMLDLFLSEGELAAVSGRLASETQRFEASEATPFADLRLVVLLDGGSASASELLAGSLAQRQRATLVGSRSYGKGSVQRVYAFEDGSALKLTVARYLLAGGLPIKDGEGLYPDVEVHRPLVPGGDLARLEAAIEALPPGERERLLPLLEPVASRLEAPEQPVQWRGGLQERLSLDPQLRASVEALRSLQ